MKQIYIAGRRVTVALENADALVAQLDVASHEGLSNFDADEALKTVVALEEIRSSLRRVTSPRTAPSSASLEAINIAVKHLAQASSVGAAGLYAAEEHASMYERSRAVKVSMESMGDTIKEILGKIIAWLKKAAKEIVRFLNDAFRGADKQAARAEGLVEKAIKVKRDHGGDAPKIDFDEEQSFVKFLGTIKSGKELVDRYNEQCKTIDDVFSKGRMLTAAANVRDLIRLFDSEGQDLDNAKVAGAVDALIKHLNNGLLGGFKGGDKDVRELAMPIGTGIIASTVVMTEGLATGMTFKLKQESDSSARLTALSPDDVVMISRAVAENCKKGAFQDYRAVAKSLDEMAEKIATSCERIVHQHSINGGQVSSLHMVQSMVKALIDLTHQAYMYNVKTAGAINAYCEASLDQKSKAKG